MLNLVRAAGAVVGMAALLDGFVRSEPVLPISSVGHLILAAVLLVLVGLSFLVPAGPPNQKTELTARQRQIIAAIRALDSADYDPTVQGIINQLSNMNIMLGPSDVRSELDRLQILGRVGHPQGKTSVWLVK